MSGIWKVLPQLSNKMAWLKCAKVCAKYSDGACPGPPPAVKQNGWKEPK